MTAELNRQLELVDVARLREAPDNPRVHPEEQVVALADSMRRFGFPSPIMVDEANIIIAGHGRLLAARKLYADGARINGLPSNRVPVVRVSGLSADEKRAYRIADNRIGGLSAFDPALLLGELNDLTGEGFDPSSLGFDTGDMERITEDAARATFSTMRAEAPITPIPNVEPREPRSTERAVEFEVEVPADDTEAIYDAIVAAKRRFGVEHAGDALAALVNAVAASVL